MKRATLTVQGMTCTGCEERIQRVLGALDGVKAVSADHTANKVSIVFDPEYASLEAARAAIEAVGYEVTR